MPMTPQEMLRKMIESIKAKTGKSFDQWVAVAKKTKIDKHKALTEHMKKTHGLDHNQAQWIAWAVTDPGRVEQYDRPQELEAELYSGKRAGLRAVYDALLRVGTGLGDDVTPNVCKTYTSLASKTQFALINPRTLKAVDLELALPSGTEAEGRLEVFKSSNPRFGHRIRITDVAEVDDEVLAALRLARSHNRS